MRNKYKGTLRYIWLICLIFSNIAFLSAGTSPLFPTSIAVNEKGELLIAEKGTKKVDIFSPDGKTLIHSFQLGDTPTGILSDGNKIYVTTFETIGRLQILSSESGKVEKSIITGSGACYPLLSSDKKYIYVCNQFQNTVSKVDIEKKEVVATVNVLREPKSAVLSKDGK